MDRREFLVAGGLAGAFTAVSGVALPTYSFAAHAVDLAMRYPRIECVWANRMLAEAWAITDGKDEAGMYAALTQRFGSFPIWFIDDRGEVVIKGVLDLTSKLEAPVLSEPYEADEVSLTEWPRKGYMCCDVRGRYLDGRSITRWAIDDPLPAGMGYYVPVDR